MQYETEQMYQKLHKRAIRQIKQFKVNYLFFSFFGFFFIILDVEEFKFETVLLV